MRPRGRTHRLMAMLALALIALLGMELAEASCHTHPAAASCAPCRVLALCLGADVPVPAPTVAILSSHAPVFLADETAARSLVVVPADGRGPPALL